MTIEVKIIADSVNLNDDRITTFVLKYPRFMHSELMTHRVFSRNASSSRAIPVSKEIELLEKDPAVPLIWTSNQKGMQGGDEIKEPGEATYVWLSARDHAIEYAKKIAELGVHKQYVNRLLEPFAHIQVVLTATDFANFFALRYHGMALPEICEVAKQMFELHSSNKPSVLFPGEWHLPFVENDERLEFSEKNQILDPSSWLPLIRRSVARCARVSYRKFDGSQSTQEEDDALYNRLLGSQPIHASPAEHQALSDGGCDFYSGNFKNWHQFRKTLDNENIVFFDGPLDKKKG